MRKSIHQSTNCENANKSHCKQAQTYDGTPNGWSKFVDDSAHKCTKAKSKHREKWTEQVLDNSATMYRHGTLE